MMKQPWIPIKLKRQNRVSEIIGNANFGNIDNLLSQGHDMDYIARRYHMDIALAWALRLEGKTDLRTLFRYSESSLDLYPN